MTAQDTRRVLALGVYMLNARNTAPDLAHELVSAREWEVEQRWAAIGAGAEPDGLEALTLLREHDPVPKFSLLNRLLEGVDLERYTYLIVTDDDIELPGGFIDRYLRLVEKHGLSLAQPARTHDSYIDHYFVAALSGVEARRTRFVEIGPLFSIARDTFGLLLPFDESAPMGWGLDLVWPVAFGAAGRHLGIVDATPVRHVLRKPVTLYTYDETDRKRVAFLKAHEHLTPDEAFVAVETYPAGPAGSTNDTGMAARE